MNINNLKKIAIYDSGKGGRSVLNELRKLSKKSNLNLELKYFCDNDNFPYGPKSQSQLETIIESNLRNIASQGYTTIIIACNTASIAGEDIYPKLEMELEIRVIKVTDWIKYASTFISEKLNKTLIIATKFTIKSSFYHIYWENSNSGNVVISKVEQNLVSYIEENNKPKILAEIDEIRDFVEVNKCDSLLLGCTHYSLFKNIFLKKMPNIILLDPSYYCALLCLDGVRTYSKEAFSHETL